MLLKKKNYIPIDYVKSNMHVIYLLGLRRFYPHKLNRSGNGKIRRSKHERKRLPADRQDQGHA